jgi:hypothetical protein
VATGGQDNKVLLFNPWKVKGADADADAGADVGVELIAHERTDRGLTGVTKLCATAGGELVSAGKDGKVVVWDVATKVPKTVLTGGHTGMVRVFPSANCTRGTPLNFTSLLRLKRACS